MFVCVERERKREGQMDREEKKQTGKWREMNKRDKTNRNISFVQFIFSCLSANFDFWSLSEEKFLSKKVFHFRKF